MLSLHTPSSRARLLSPLLSPPSFYAQSRCPAWPSPHSKQPGSGQTDSALSVVQRALSGLLTCSDLIVSLEDVVVSGLRAEIRDSDLKNKSPRVGTPGPSYLHLSTANFTEPLLSVSAGFTLRHRRVYRGPGATRLRSDASPSPAPPPPPLPLPRQCVAQSRPGQLRWC